MAAGEEGCSKKLTARCEGTAGQEGEKEGFCEVLAMSLKRGAVKEGRWRTVLTDEKPCPAVQGGLCGTGGGCGAEREVRGKWEGSGKGGSGSAGGPQEPQGTDASVVRATGRGRSRWMLGGE